MSSSRVFKLVILGDPQVGKTSIRKKYMGQGFSKSYLQTMGADFSVKKIEKNEIAHEIQVWDIAGQTGFKKIIPRFINRSNAVMFVFDLSRRDTFMGLLNWIELFRKINQEKIHQIPGIILGNKNDLENHLITEDDVSKLNNHLRENFDMVRGEYKYLTTSALTGDNIDKAFKLILDELLG